MDDRSFGLGDRGRYPAKRSLMSTRTSLIADPDGKQQELAEGLGGLPLLWIPMLTTEDIAAAAESPQVTISRKDSVDRICGALQFLKHQFPDIDDLSENAQELLAHLKKSRPKTVAIDMTDPVCMDADNFLAGLAVAVAAIEAGDETATFTVGRHKYQSTRDVLCYLSTLDPDNGVAEREQMIGDLW